MKLLARLKKVRENKKGFTLVELIVVIVILAILAAILVPSLTGWIDKARDKQILVDARSAYLAAQGLASEKYGKTGEEPEFEKIDIDAILKLAELTGKGKIESADIVYDKESDDDEDFYPSKIIGFIYQDNSSEKYAVLTTEKIEVKDKPDKFVSSWDITEEKPEKSGTP